MTVKDHLFIILAEECAEVAQRATKALRFGIDETQPGQTEDNRQRLIGELADLRAACEMLEVCGVDLTINPKDVEAKKRKIHEFLMYSASLGRVE